MTKQTYQNAVDTLLDAYLKGNLEHGTCKACAVGNLLRTPDWKFLFFTGIEDGQYKKPKTFGKTT